MADDSLDDELLAAVGRSSGGGSSRKPSLSSRASSKRGRHELSSDEEDYEDEPSEFKRDSDDDEDDDADDSEVDKAGASSSRKAPGSKMPLKKRIDIDDDDASGDGYESELSFGSDLYKDEDDKEWLHSMTELDRELILHERGERRDNVITRKKGATRLKRDGEGPSPASGKVKDHHHHQTPPSSSRIRSSTRESSASVKKHALNKLISARRQKDHESGQRRNNSMRRPSPPQREESEEESEEDSRSGDDEDEEAQRSHRKDGKSKDADDPTLEDICNVTIRRSKLAKWFLEPFFEEIIVGCFVRVGVGVKDGVNCYRLCQVRNVDASDPRKQYKFENRMTHKWLNLVWGDSEVRWQMARISDQHPTQTEFEQWEKEVKKSHSRNLKPTLLDITEKREAIAKLSSFVYSAEKVKKMLHEKKMSSSRPSNVAAEKDRLSKELAFAESKEDQEEIDRIQARLKELEAYSMQNLSKNAKAMALAQMNRRNRFENFKNASDLKPVMHAKAGEAGYDPFSRRWTRSQNYYNRASKTDSTDTVKTVEAATEAAREAAKDAGKLTDTQAPVKDTTVFSLHNFPLRISLAGIQKFGGAQGAHLAFIARKQRLEATCGVPVENSDGRRHMLTLTVNDYKRRRGLL